MRKAGNIAVAMVMAGAFIFTSMFCCLTHYWPQAKAHACCAKTAHGTPGQSDCGACPLVLKSVDTAQTFNFTAPSFIIAFTGVVPFAFKPVQVFLKSAFLNGPPGPIYAVPLYTQFHSLRI